ncbi:MAG: OsmC family protein [Anaerolineae bacterium]|jgi:uncharacterized OsmC-like protein
MTKITAQLHGQSLFQTQLGDHVIHTDPSGIEAPSPPEVLVASLGACVGILVSDYCERVGIDTEGLTVDVEYGKASNPYRLANFEVTINLPKGDVNGRERAILRVAEHCPVHQTMRTLEGADIRINGKAA